MSVKITLYGADQTSDEYMAGSKLKAILQEGMPASAEGEIVLYASATLYGQAVKDVDLLMIGKLTGYSVNSEFYVENEEGESVKTSGTVEVESFVTTIELKRHDISRIYVKGTDIYVKYKDHDHSATAQSNDQ